ncbi:MAG: glycoside hydrolase [Actinomycetota bacterium]|nr:glycoside hydrolase [Actinomycetota bacterium]
MSELDSRLAALRDDLHGSITPPELVRLTARARQRTTRRRMQIGAVAAVVAVSVAVPVLRALPDDHRPATPPLPDSMTIQLDFADTDHGYALGSDCPVPEGSCTLTLFATTDGGRTWERRPLPDHDKRYSLGDVSVLGADRVVLSRVSEKKQWARVVSDDGGRTWHDASAGPAAAPAPIPDGTWLQTVCVGDEQDAAGCRIGVGTLSEDPERVAPAPSQPPLIEPVIGRSATEGGRYWAAGVERSSGRWAISVTSDGGRTWQTTRVSLPGEPAMIDAWSVVENDGVMYATLQGSIAKGPFGLLAVFRSTDGGVTWTNTWRATPKTVLQAMLGSAVATDDGRLLVYSATTGTHESTDGRTFTRSEVTIPGEVQWTRGGYVAQRGPHTYAMSTDGIRWRIFEIR